MWKALSIVLLQLVHLPPHAAAIIRINTDVYIQGSFHSHFSDFPVLTYCRRGLSEIDDLGIGRIWDFPKPYWSPFPPCSPQFLHFKPVFEEAAFPIQLNSLQDCFLRCFITIHMSINKVVGKRCKELNQRRTVYDPYNFSNSPTKLELRKIGTQGRVNVKNNKRTEWEILTHLSPILPTRGKSFPLDADFQGRNYDGKFKLISNL